MAVVTAFRIHTMSSLVNAAIEIATTPTLFVCVSSPGTCQLRFNDQQGVGVRAGGLEWDSRDFNRRIDQDAHRVVIESALAFSI